MATHQNTDWMLIIEDQLDFWTLLQVHLKRGLPNRPLIHFSEPAAAIRYLQQCSDNQQPLPGMVLSDLYLPQLAVGLDFLAQFKEPASPFAHLPLVIISSSTQNQDRQDVNRLGGSFQPKPINPDEWGEFVSIIQYYWHKRLKLDHYTSKESL